uniref:Uncharacterized protein n=1 Tax=Anguilla anguilla TaxID=7936 RepID=A0A0E9X8X8_ANGAN
MHTNHHPDRHTKHTNHCFLKKTTKQKNIFCMLDFLIALTFVLVTYLWTMGGDDDDETHSRNVRF